MESASDDLKMEPFLLPAQPAPPSPEPQRPTQSPSRRDPSTVAAASSSSTSEATAGLSPSLDPGHHLEDNDGPPSSIVDVVVAADDGGITLLEEINGDGKEGGIKRWKEEDEAEENCCICLQTVRDRTVMPACGHDSFCFHCLAVWTEQSRKCPLCSAPIGPYLLHNLWTPPPYLKFFLPPLASKPSTSNPQHPVLPPPIRRRELIRRDRGRGPVDPVGELDEFERKVERRREIYRWGLYCKHVAANASTRYRPTPTPAQFASNSDLISKATVFLRREFRVWSGVDVEFMVNYTLSLMRSIDIRSDPAVRLLAEFLDIGNEAEQKNAEHFAHEVYSYLRSPFRDLNLYDAAVQYDPIPAFAAQRREEERRARSPHFSQASPSRNRPQQPPRRRSPSPSRSRSPPPKRRRSSLGGGRRPPLLDLDDEEDGLGEAVGRGTRAGETGLSGDEESDDGSERSRGRGLSRERRGSSMEDGSRSRSRSYSRSPSRSRSGSYSRSRSRSFSPLGSRRRTTARHSRSPPPRQRSLSPRSRRTRTDTWLSPEEAERLEHVRAARGGVRSRERQPERERPDEDAAARKERQEREEREWEERAEKKRRGGRAARMREPKAEVELMDLVAEGAGAGEVVEKLGLKQEREKGDGGVKESKPKGMRAWGGKEDREGLSSEVNAGSHLVQIDPLSSPSSSPRSNRSTSPIDRSPAPLPRSLSPSQLSSTATPRPPTLLNRISSASSSRYAVPLSVPRPKPTPTAPHVKPALQLAPLLQQEQQARCPPSAPRDAVPPSGPALGLRISGAAARGGRGRAGGIAIAGRGRLVGQQQQLQQFSHLQSQQPHGIPPPIQPAPSNSLSSSSSTSSALPPSNSSKPKPVPSVPGTKRNILLQRLAEARAERLANAPPPSVNDPAPKISSATVDPGGDRIIGNGSSTKSTGRLPAPLSGSRGGGELGRGATQTDVGGVGVKSGSIGSESELRKRLLARRGR